MKLIKIFAVAVFALYAASINAAVGDYVSSAYKKVDRINLRSGDNGATYYFIAEGGNWGSSGCPNAKYAYIYESDHASKAILSVVLSARVSGMLVKFEGTCGSGSSDRYIKVVRVEV